MKIVVAPDSFKECLASHQVGSAIAAGILRAIPEAELTLVPMADGGQGTVEALVRATSGEYLEAMVTGPVGQRVNARYGVLGNRKTAVLEMAAASGLELVPRDQRDPMGAHTFGTGELLLEALSRDVERVILGIGGSASNDGGAGFAEALGYRLLDSFGGRIPRGGGGLGQLAHIEPPEEKPWEGIRIDVACDVTNPLTGPTGASAIYGPQKGATPEMVEILDRNLKHFSAIVRRDLNVDVESVPGAGAAGGLGGGLMAFANARLARGVELVLDVVGMRERLRGAHLCVTGEGSLDQSSPFGKTAVGVASLCKELGVPVVVLAGGVRPEAHAVHEQGVTAYFPITQRPCTLEEAIAQAPEWLASTAEQVLRVLSIPRHP